MKTLVWSVSIAFVVVCVGCWMLASWVTPMLDGFGTHIPAFTRFVLRPHSWILFCPLPCLILATRLSRRQQLNRKAAFLFSGTVILTAVLLTAAVGTASILPMLQTCYRGQQQMTEYACNNPFQSPERN